MATVLSTTGAELIGFQSQLCRVSHQPAPSRTSTLLTPLSPLKRSPNPYSELPLDGDRGSGDNAVAGRRRVDIAIASADYAAFSMRLAPVNSEPRGFKDFVRDMRGNEREGTRELLRAHQVGQMQR